MVLKIPFLSKYNGMIVALIVSLLAPGCSNGQIDSDEFAVYVKNHQIGRYQDYWIEMHNSFGEWEKTGLIFGYWGDDEECAKVIAGLGEANPGREYRCSAAQ